MTYLFTAIGILPIIALSAAAIYLLPAILPSPATGIWLSRALAP